MPIRPQTQKSVPNPAAASPVERGADLDPSQAATISRRYPQATTATRASEPRTVFCWPLHSCITDTAASAVMHSFCARPFPVPESAEGDAVGRSSRVCRGSPPAVRWAAIECRRSPTCAGPTTAAARTSAPDRRAGGDGIGHRMELDGVGCGEGDHGCGHHHEPEESIPVNNPLPTPRTSRNVSDSDTLRCLQCALSCW